MVLPSATMAQKVSVIHTTRDHRTILSGRHYTQLRYDVWLRQDRCCIACGRSISFEFAELHHKDHGRGMAGSKRTDTPEATEIRCHKCHRSVTPKPQWTAKNSLTS